ncbi:phospholipase A2 [Microcaecilia unicolor]|uniref:Phospholipase A2 n=1 Tax=Microcaecilia unicolor TaxID=1415580 RepID=A0A6P7Z011_9AMPH|nr:group 10 secretory phospholipase A2 [Microcaecilia unicolor]
MEPRALLLLLLQAVLKVSPGKSHVVKTRGLIELAGAIQCSTGRSALAYIGYGCYCGLGGRGWPRDQTDWCCHKHDCCYEMAELAGCSPKMGRYQWTCEDEVVECETLDDRCEKILCKCDSEAAKCLSKAPYNLKNIFWPDFLCGRDHPTCSYH